MVVAEKQKLALIRGMPKSKDRIDAGEAVFWFWRIKIEYIRWFHIEGSGDQEKEPTDDDCEALSALCPSIHRVYSLFWDSGRTEWCSC